MNNYKQRSLTVSIVIATKNRPDHLKRCLASLTSQSTKPNEIFVIDQSTNIFSKNITSQFSLAFPSINIQYTHQIPRGISHARNVGIRSAQSQVVAFTDDDCIADDNWVPNITNAFVQHKDINAIFGQIKPFVPTRTRHARCPCLFLDTHTQYINSPCAHWKHIGFGNNMAFRKHLFNTHGEFKEWLGVGSIGKSAEDAEYALRLLLNKQQIMYNPKILIYHNRWLTQKEMTIQNLLYTCGEMACYGYFHFLGHKFATSIIRNNIQDSLHKMKNIILRILSFRWDKQLWLDVYTVNMENIYRLWGALVGYYFSFIDPTQ